MDSHKVHVSVFSWGLSHVNNAAKWKFIKCPDSHSLLVVTRVGVEGSGSWAWETVVLCSMTSHNLLILIRAFPDQRHISRKLFNLKHLISWLPVTLKSLSRCVILRIVIPCCNARRMLSGKSFKLITVSKQSWYGETDSWYFRNRWRSVYHLSKILHRSLSIKDRNQLNSIISLVTKRTNLTDDVSSHRTGSLSLSPLSKSSSLTNILHQNMENVKICVM